MYKSLSSSALCALALGRRSRSIAALGSKHQAFLIKRGYQQPIKGFFINPCLNAHNSGLEWNFLKIKKPKINSLKCFRPLNRIQVNFPSMGLANDIDDPLALVRGGSYLENLFWHVANTIDTTPVTANKTH